MASLVFMAGLRSGGLSTLAVLALVGGPALAQSGRGPENILPQSASNPASAQPRQAQPRPAAAVPSSRPVPASTAAAVPVARPAALPVPAAPAPVAISLPVAEPIMRWTQGDAQALLGVIQRIDSEGLIAADYKPDVLRAAIAAGESDALDVAASHAFTWLAEDLRDGRTPMTSRIQWFAVDPDRDNNPTDQIMARALATHDVAGVLAGLAPTHPDYLALKSALAATPRTATTARALIRANMDRWRWLPRELGDIYLLTNVPEFQLRLVKRNHQIVRTYRTIVGKPGRTATPQLAETVQAVVFNPTWTVPQSIVQGEGLGPRLLANPRSATAQGYKATRGQDGFITVVQQPGPNNALGLMKIDMPNPHAIYLHDTPSRNLFNNVDRAYSHGCIRTERAVELGITMAILGAGLDPNQGAELSRAGKYQRVVMTKTFPVYITYFTMAQDITGKLSTFKDLYGRDAAVLASFTKAREAKTTQRASDEPVIQLDNPL